MKIIINCEADEIGTYLVGLCEYFDINYREVKLNFAVEGFLTNNGLHKEFRRLLENCIDSDTRTRIDCSEIAEKMWMLYPSGIKPGTIALWKGNKTENRNLLKKFFGHYPGYTPEDVIDATEKYVAMFKDDNTYMKTLPRFIYDESKNNSMLATVIDYINENPCGNLDVVPDDEIAKLWD